MDVKPRYSATLFVPVRNGDPKRDAAPEAGFTLELQLLDASIRSKPDPDDLAVLVQLAAGLSGSVAAQKATEQLLALYAEAPSQRTLIESMCLQLAYVCQQFKGGSQPPGWKHVPDNPLAEAQLPVAILYLAGRDPGCGGEQRNYVADELSLRVKESLDPDAPGGDRAFGDDLLHVDRFVTHQELYGCAGDVHERAPVRTFNLDLTDAAGIAEPVRRLKEAMLDESQKTHLVFVNTGGHWTLLALVRDPDKADWEAVYFDSLGGHAAQVSTALTNAGLEYGTFSVVDPSLQTDADLHCACGPLALMAAKKIRDLPDRGTVNGTFGAVQQFAQDFAAKSLPDRQAAVIAERARMLAAIEGGARREERGKKAAEERAAAE